MGVPKLPADLFFESKAVLITGSNAGIGRELVRAFLRRKAKTLYLVVRSLDKGNAAITSLKEDPVVKRENPDADIRLYQCDQSSFESTRAFCQKFREEVKSLDIAVLNAGVNSFAFETTGEGWEVIFQVNYFTTAWIAIEMLPLLKEGNKPGQSKLFITSSLAHRLVKWDTKNLLKEDVNILEFLASEKSKPRHASDVYGVSKLAVTAFVEELAAHEKDIIINCACPGVVATGLDKRLPGWIRYPLSAYKKCFARDAYVAAETLILTIVSEKTGTYWADGVVKPHAKTMDTKEGKAIGKKLYEQTLVKCKELDPEMTLPQA